MQLDMVISPCKIAEIDIWIDNDEGQGYEWAKDNCQLIDEALTSDNFPSLRCVNLHKGIPDYYFPVLLSRKLLQVYRRTSAYSGTY